MRTGKYCFTKKSNGPDRQVMLTISKPTYQRHMIQITVKEFSVTKWNL